MLLMSRWENMVFLPLKEDIILPVYILEAMNCKIFQWRDMTCALLFFGMELFFFLNNVFRLIISTKALSNLSHFQHHFLTRQREL